MDQPNAQQGPHKIINLTQEQQDIIKAFGTGRNLLVCALAGTGKTSTLLSIAKAYPQKKGLYLAYNKALQLEAREKFPRYIRAKTIHGLAYEDVGTCYTSQLTQKLNISTIVDYLEITPLRQGRCFATPELIAVSAHDMVKTFCYSLDHDLTLFHYSKRCIDLLLDKYKWLKFNLENVEFPASFIEHFVSQSFDYAKTLWDAMSDPANEAVPASHDTYLKIYQLREPIIKGYDYIMLDEAQDANPVILDILSRQNAQRIYVGDENQQIYGFRGTINAMSALDGDTYYLTQSFRFGNAVAEEANKVLKALNVTNLIKGHDQIQSRVGPINGRLPYTFIARTNAELIKRIVSKESNSKKIHFVGGVAKVLSLFESAYFLNRKQLSKVSDASLKRFPSWDKFVEEANLSKDHEYLGITNFIYEYGNKVPKVLDLIKKLCSYEEREADVVMTTAHKAKGRQWSQIHVHDDFLSDAAVEEKNIYYVALTRAIDVLYIASGKALN